MKKSLYLLHKYRKEEGREEWIEKGRKREEM